MPQTQYGSKWSEEETTLAFFYYCQIPFGKIGKSNPKIIELAALLGRTPSSVGLKMCNLGSFDPNLQSRGLVGMRNASRLDKEIVERYSNDWDNLAFNAKRIEESLKSNSVWLSSLPVGADRLALVKERMNQDFFRGAVLSAYSGKCCITGISVPDLLIASHIKPWANSDPRTERTNPCNGLCLNALHDKAFDTGLITVLPDYTIRVSDKLKQDAQTDSNMAWIVQYDKQKIILPERFCPGREYLEYHNDMVFNHF